MRDRPAAVVTGSTSGIGLGIAEALAAEGMDIMLNGFGDALEIERTRIRIQDDYCVKVGYNGADMKRHPVIGYDLLKDVSGMRQLPAIARRS